MRVKSIGIRNIRFNVCPSPIHTYHNIENNAIMFNIIAIGCIETSILKIVFLLLF